MWKKLDIRNDASIFPVFLFESGTGKNSAMHRALGTSLSGFMHKFERGTWTYYEQEGDLERLNREMVSKIEKDPSFAKRAIEETYSLGKRLLSLTQKITDADLSKKTNAELWEYYKGYCKRCKEMRGYAWIAPALDAASVLSGRLNEIILEKIKKLKLPDSPAEIFTTLTEPKKETMRMQEERELSRIASMMKRREDARKPDIQRMLLAHKEKYEWLPALYENDPYSIEDFEKRLIEIFEKGARKKEKKNVKIPFKLNKKEKYLFSIASEMIFFKADRKDILFKSYFQMRPLLTEVGRRLDLDLRQVRNMLPNEVKQGLIEGITNPKLYLERYDFSVIVSKDDNTVAYTGDEARRILDREVIKEEILETDELMGQCASPGYGKGKAKLIFSPRDIPKMEEGDVLVAPATNPDILPAMKKASAIVTNTGGITCHAAIVSRELGIPCVIGTRIATDTIKDGDLLLVDADRGIVRRIKHA